MINLSQEELSLFKEELCTKNLKKKKINLKNPQELFKATGPVDWVISKSFSVDALF